MFKSRTSSIILLCMLSYFCRSQEIYKPKFYSDPFLNNSLPFKKWKSLKGNIKSVETNGGLQKTEVFHINFILMKIIN